VGEQIPSRGRQIGEPMEGAHGGGPMLSVTLVGRDRDIGIAVIRMGAYLLVMASAHDQKTAR
jgi:hypothetical protein